MQLGQTFDCRDVWVLKTFAVLNIVALKALLKAVIAAKEKLQQRQTFDCSALAFKAASLSDVWHQLHCSHF